MIIFKKLCVGLVTVLTLLTLAIPITWAAEEEKAVEPIKFEKQAKVLYDIKLFAGSDPEKYVPNLEGVVTREQGIAMIIRLLGMEQEARELTSEDVENILKPYSDKYDISGWAKNYVALSVSQKIVKGTSIDTISPQCPLLGKQFATIILQNLGYIVDPIEDYNKAASILVDRGAIYSISSARKFADKELIRDDFVGMAFGSIYARKEDRTTLLDILVKKKVLNDKDKKIIDASSFYFD